MAIVFHVFLGRLSQALFVIVCYKALGAISNDCLLWVFFFACIIVPLWNGAHLISKLVLILSETLLQIIVQFQMKLVGVQTAGYFVSLLGNKKYRRIFCQ